MMKGNLTPRSAPPRDRSALDAAKQRLGISGAWRALGLAGEPASLTRSPFREDRHPSFSISSDQLWFDHATHEGGDVVDFIRRATGCSCREAIDRVLELAGSSPQPATTPAPWVVAPASLPDAPVRPPELHLPLLRMPTVRELAQLADLRRLPVFAGLECAARSGMLHAASMWDAGEKVQAWVLLDSARRCAQARRLDGRLWQNIGAKAKTLPGSQAAWPIGAADIGSRPYVALCEGGPDALTAWTLSWWHDHCADIAPVCMAGSHPIHAEALGLFSGKGVWIFPHRDPAGERARATWTEQLGQAGSLWVKPFDVAPHKDFNEWLNAMVAKAGGDE